MASNIVTHLWYAFNCFTILIHVLLINYINVSEQYFKIVYNVVYKMIRVIDLACDHIYSYIYTSYKYF